MAFEQDYPVVAAFLDKQWEFLASISPIHTRREDLSRTVSAYLDAALTRQEGEWIPETLMAYGLEADSYGLLLELDQAFGAVLAWAEEQWSIDLLRLGARLDDLSR